MTPQEIKYNYSLKRHSYVFTQSGKGYLAEIDCSSYPETKEGQRDADENAELILRAVNNTFGKGINPKAVEDMLNACKILYSVLYPLVNNPVHETVMKQLEAAIQKSKL